MNFKITFLRVDIPEKSVKNRMFIFPDGETIMDNLINRHSRPHQIYKKEVIPLVMKELKKKFPDTYKKVKDNTWKWSQYAGCSCGCSPGFIGSTKDNVEIFVDVKMLKDGKEKKD